MSATGAYLLAESPYKELVCGFLTIRDILFLRTVSRRVRDALGASSTLIWRRVFADAEHEQDCKRYNVINHVGEKAESILVHPLLRFGTAQGVRFIESARSALGFALPQVIAHRALVDACCRGDLSAAQHLAEMCEPEVEVYSADGCRASTANLCLRAASMSGDAEFVGWIVEHFAMQDCHPIILIDTAGRGRLDCIKWLLGRFKVLSLSGQLAIDEAAKNGHLETVRWLMTVFNISRKDTSAVYPCFLTALCANQMGVVMWLTREGLANDCSVDLDHILSLACEKGHTEAVAWMHEVWDISAGSAESTIKLFRTACLAGHLSLVQWFLAKLPETARAIPSKGCNIVRVACAKGHAAIVEALCVAGNVKRWKQIDADFIQLCERGALHVLQVLVSKLDFAPNLETAIQRSAATGRFDVVRWLVESHGAAALDDATATALWVGRDPDQMGWLHKNKLFTGAAINEAFKCACACNKLKSARWLASAQCLDIGSLKQLESKALNRRHCDIVQLVREQIMYRRSPRIINANLRRLIR